MNKQIKELFEQAKAESSQWLGSKPAIAMTYDGLERFAELIVLECAGVGEQYADGNYEVRNQILRHFGLEEQ